MSEQREWQEKPSCAQPPGCVPFQYCIVKTYKDGIARRHCPNCSNAVKITENECMQLVGSHTWKEGVSGKTGKAYSFCVNCAKRGVPPAAAPTLAPPAKRPTPPPTITLAPTSDEEAQRSAAELMNKMDYLIKQQKEMKEMLLAQKAYFEL